MVPGAFLPQKSPQGKPADGANPRRECYHTQMMHWVRRHHKKIREIGTGLALYEGFTFVYDFLFYPFAIAYWGFAEGGTIAVAFTFLINGVVFWFYEYMAVDWLGAHALHELEAKENKSRFEHFATWIGKEKKMVWEKLANPIVFAFLTLPIDPVIVAVHYRKQHFKGITWRDWGLLFAATAIANAWWLLKVGAIVEGARFLYHALF